MIYKLLKYFKNWESIMAGRNKDYPLIRQFKFAYHIYFVGRISFE